MSDCKVCDVCRAHLARSPEVATYVLETRDEVGDLPSRDLCSPQCLAAAALNDSFEAGVAREHEAVRLAAMNGPKVVKRWWLTR